jgi:hypothetical protein
MEKLRGKNDLDSNKSIHIASDKINRAFDRAFDRAFHQAFFGA